MAKWICHQNLEASSNDTEQQKITLLWSELGGVFCENGAST